MIASVLRLLCRALFRVEVRGKSNVTSYLAEQGVSLLKSDH